jgi:hypothetical protein
MTTSTSSKEESPLMGGDDHPLVPSTPTDALLVQLLEEQKRTNKLLSALLKEEILNGQLLLR